METGAPDQSNQKNSSNFRKNLLKLTIGGGIIFWIATFITSLLPIAAEYRAAFSNWSKETVWVGSIFAGVITGFGVSYFLLRFFDKIPTKNPVLKSVIVSLIALVIVTILLDVPQSIFGSSDVSNAWYYFLIGVSFNVVRFLLLGLIVGCLYEGYKSQ